MTTFSEIHAFPVQDHNGILNQIGDILEEVSLHLICLQRKAFVLLGFVPFLNYFIFHLETNYMST